MRRAPSNRAVFCFAAGRVFSMCLPDRSPRSGGTPASGRARQWYPPSLRTRSIQSSSLCFESLCGILERSEESRSLKLVSERRFDYYLARVRMSRSAPCFIRLARFVAGEAAPLARVRVLLSRERRPTATAVGGEGSATAHKEQKSRAG